jgi:protein phosphatase
MVNHARPVDAATVRLPPEDPSQAGRPSSVESELVRPLLLRPGNAQWIGTRSEQEDAFAFDGCDVDGATPGGTVLVVLADGMGGLQAGGEASRIAVSTFRSYVAAQPADLPVAEALEVALHAANRAVHELALNTAGEGEVGTTLVAAAVRGSALQWVSVGDSRLYLYNGASRSLTRCTEDHTLARELEERFRGDAWDGEVPSTHPDRNVLTSFLGLAEVPAVDRNRRPFTLQPGDRLLLCSDGVDGVLTLEELAAPLAGEPQAAAEALISAVRARGLDPQDNATVAVLACDGLSAPASPTRSARPSRWRLWALLIGGMVALGLAAAAVAWRVGWWSPDRTTPTPPADRTPAAVADGMDTSTQVDVVPASDATDATDAAESSTGADPGDDAASAISEVIQPPAPEPQAPGADPSPAAIPAEP